MIKYEMKYISYEVFTFGLVKVRVPYVLMDYYCTNFFSAHYSEVRTGSM